MSLSKPEITSQQEEKVTPESIAAMRRYGARLFLEANHPFGGISGAGSHAKTPHENARYLIPETYELCTVRTRGIEEESAVLGRVVIEIEIPIPPSLRRPNTYLRERFTTSPAGGGRFDFRYALGASAYTPEGQYVPFIDDIVDIQANHPDLVQSFGFACQREHFLDRLLTLTQLTTTDEIGCEPNPYNKVY